MCLNGIRCAAKYIWNNSFAPIGKVNFQTKTKNIICEPRAKKMIQVHIEPPDKIVHKSLYNKLKNISYVVPNVPCATNPFIGF